MWNRGPDSAGRLSGRAVYGPAGGVQVDTTDYKKFIAFNEEDNMAIVHDTSATLAQCILITVAG